MIHCIIRRCLSPAVDLIPRPTLLLYNMYCRIFNASNSTEVLTEVLVLFKSLRNIVIFVNNSHSVVAASRDI